MQHLTRDEMIWWLEAHNYIEDAANARKAYHKKEGVKNIFGKVLDKL